MTFSRYLQTLSISTSFVVIVGSYLVRIEIESRERVVESCPSVPACRLLEPVARSQGERSPDVAGGPFPYGQRDLPSRSGPSYPRSSNVFAGSGRQQHFQELAERASGLCGVPPDLFARLVQRESTWRQYDALGRVLKSSSGALGLAQVKPGTGRGISKTLDLNDPWQNLLAGSCYLRQMYDRFGSWEHAVLAYRVGPAGLSTREVRAYVQDVMEGM